MTSFVSPVPTVGGVLPELRLAQAPDLLASIGHTPLFPLRRLGADLPEGVQVLAKGEHLNPGGSVKDRPARAMLLDGVRSGRLRPGRTILEATSGNTGIALALLGAALGYPVTLCLPANASPERKRILRAYGADILETDRLTGTDGAQRAARALADAQPERYWYPDQYNNAANWRAHLETTAPEFWEQTRGRITHFVAGVGTGGTFVGTARGLKARHGAVQAVALHPDSPLHGIEGLKHLETALVPGIYDPALADAHVRVATEDAHATARRLAAEEGLFVGVSAGANVFAALRLARTLAPGSVVVTVLCDSGSRYLGDRFWEER
jgi:cysteine synthase B